MSALGEIGDLEMISFNSSMVLISLFLNSWISMLNHWSTALPPVAKGLELDSLGCNRFTFKARYSASLGCQEDLYLEYKGGNDLDKVEHKRDTILALKILRLRMYQPSTIS